MMWKEKARIDRNPGPKMKMQQQQQRKSHRKGRSVSQISV